MWSIFHNDVDNGVAPTSLSIPKVLLNVDDKYNSHVGFAIYKLQYLDMMIYSEAHFKSMILLHIVRLTLEVDMQPLGDKCVNGLRVGDRELRCHPLTKMEDR